MTTAQTPEPDEADYIKRLELIAAEIKIRDEDETNRQKTADSKLLSALAALPIVIALSTTAFVPLLKVLVPLGCVGLAIVVLLLVSIFFFLIATVKAIIGLWPMRAKYAAIGLRTLANFVERGEYRDLLLTVIRERSDVVRHNTKVNGEKLGLYAEAALYTTIGLIAIVLTVFFLVVAFAVKPIWFAK